MARRPFSSQSLVLIVIAIAINMIGGQLISMLKLPIFLDSIGTLISAVLLGPFIGMLTGLLTNLLWGLLTDPIAAAFAPVAMVIGLVAGWLARAGWFRTLPKVIVSGVVITLAVTLVAVPLRTALFGGLPLSAGAEINAAAGEVCRLADAVFRVWAMAGTWRLANGMDKRAASRSAALGICRYAMATSAGDRVDVAAMDAVCAGSAVYSRPVRFTSAARHRLPVRWPSAGRRTAQTTTDDRS